MKNHIEWMNPHGCSRYAIHISLFNRVFMVFILTAEWEWGFRSIVGGYELNLGPIRLAYLCKEIVELSENYAKKMLANLEKRQTETEKINAEQQ